MPSIIEGLLQFKIQENDNIPWSRAVIVTGIMRRDGLLVGVSAFHEVGRGFESGSGHHKNCTKQTLE